MSGEIIEFIFGIVAGLVIAALLIVAVFFIATGR